MSFLKTTVYLICTILMGVLFIGLTTDENKKSTIKNDETIIHQALADYFIYDDSSYLRKVVYDEMMKFGEILVDANALNDTVLKYGMYRIDIKNEKSLQDVVKYSKKERHILGIRLSNITNNNVSIYIFGYNLLKKGKRFYHEYDMGHIVNYRYDCNRLKWIKVS